MKEYVLCLAHPIPHANTNNVVLILRKKLDWQEGKLNFPGGSIYGGEPVEKAAHRELKEETSIDASLPDIRVLGTLEGDVWRVHVCFCPYHQHKNGGPQKAITTSDEGEIVTMAVSEALADPRLIPNLKLLIPFFLARLTGWQIREAAGQQLLTVSL